jgi:hypothetical protein
MSIKIIPFLSTYLIQKSFRIFVTKLRKYEKSTKNLFVFAQKLQGVPSFLLSAATLQRSPLYISSHPCLHVSYSLLHFLSFLSPLSAAAEQLAASLLRCYPTHPYPFLFLSPVCLSVCLSVCLQSSRAA